MTQTVRREPARARTFLMCPPDYFSVEYTINPWMTGTEPVDRGLARAQWEFLRRTYTDLGHTVRTVTPVPGLPDMVFAANGGTAIGGKALGAWFYHPERAAEGPAYLSWLRGNGYPDAVEAGFVNEGEGDIVFAGNVIFAGHGFRTDPGADRYISDLFGLPVLSLRLMLPHYYHLDTALIVLDASTAAYYPPAFDDASRAALGSHFAELIEAKDEDAEELGLNGLSDGRNVVMPVQAGRLADQISEAGFDVVPVDLSEFKKAGGGPKCCTLELR
jgi:N-dimethylarginine dimethylaminohydrolase